MSNEARQRMSEVRKGKLTPHMKEHLHNLRKANQKPVEVTYPSGRVGVFNSCQQAFLFVPFSEHTLVRLLKGELTRASGKGYSARYLPTEAAQ